ncbi:MAG: hypothetical protein IT548_07965 [Alphaproteobacteria bacterium]|nr:hypothetical protein [Alphaproteobacteria bacterium]
MSNALKWFARTSHDEDEARPETEDERSENTLEAFDLPPHVQEFLALKSAAGV